MLNKRMVLVNSILLVFVLFFVINGCRKYENIYDPDIEVPTVKTSSEATIGINSVVTGGQVLETGGIDIIERGIYYSQTALPDTNLKVIGTNSKGTGSFDVTLGNLNSSTQYYIRAFARNKKGIGLGDIMSFTTKAYLTGNVPSITTIPISNLTAFSAISGGNISSQGSSSIIAKGVCWSTSINPTINNSLTNNGTGNSNFSSSMNSLSQNTTYYLRAYATNANGTAYGNQITFITSAASVSIPSITTVSASNITLNSCMSGGNISSSGSSSISAKGVCWNTSSNPTINNYLTIDGNGSSNFTSSLSSLSQNTTYYLRAYATNSNGTAYGNQISFTTGSLPNISTISAFNITQNSSISGGNITSQGGSSILSKGVCWSTSSNPTINNSLVNNGSGNANFSSTLTPLTSNTLYYARAYATNSFGTSYGNEITFNTSPSFLLAPVLTSPINSVSVACCYIYLNWNSVSGASGYEIQISKSNSFSAAQTTISSGGICNPLNVNVANITGNSSNSFMINTGTSSNNGTWYWRVRAYAGTIYSSWSLNGSYNYTF
jgi:hypothetical protein